MLDAPPDDQRGVLAADTAVLLGDGAVVMRPSCSDRRRETERCEAVLREAGIPIVARIEPPGLLDGSDVVVSGETVFVGVADGGPAFAAHSNALGREQLTHIAGAAGFNVVELRYAGRFPRLRSVFTPLSADTVVVASGAVDAAALERFKRIEVARGEELAAGLLVLGERRVLANLRFRTSLPLLRDAKLAVEAIDLWEFGKTGAAPSMLALALRRE